MGQRTRGAGTAVTAGGVPQHNKYKYARKLVGGSVRSPIRHAYKPAVKLTCSRHGFQNPTYDDLLLAPHIEHIRLSRLRQICYSLQGVLTPGVFAERAWPGILRFEN